MDRTDPAPARASGGARAAPMDYRALAKEIKAWGRALGFQQVGIADTDLAEAEEHLQNWLQQGHHGTMSYMARHGRKRSRPGRLVPGTIRVISVRMNYLSETPETAAKRLAEPLDAYLSRYALGRDYHKVLRKRLTQLAERIARAAAPFGYRAFVDSAPVLEKALAAKAGLGWVGKHSNLLHPEAGSWFFLGELYTDLPLPTDHPIAPRCGTCTACIDVCPTRAIVAPYQVDARRCISYLTIELRDAIPEKFRPLIGNRIFGCDDCQLVCPWNRFARLSRESDFKPRHGLDAAQLIELFAWDEATFLRKSEGSAIRRVGHVGWLRNIAVALGNAATSPPVLSALSARRAHPSPLVGEHVDWALDQHRKKCSR